ncbi:MAG TPA: type II toxin-antitoxin system ParD family antitoxin [Humisphaera sp.]
MNVALSPEAERLVQQNISAGRYATPEDVVTAALASLAQSNGDFASGEMERLLAEGEASIARDGTLDGDAALEARRQRRAQRSPGRP